MKVHAIPTTSYSLHYTDSFFRWGVRFAFLKITAAVMEAVAFFRRVFDSPIKVPSKLEGYENRDFIDITRSRRPYGNGTAFSAFKKIFERKFQGQNVALDLSYITAEEHPEVAEDAIIAVPIVLEGYFRDHIVNLIINTKENRMEFFDSKGQKLGDRIHDKVWAKNITLAQVVAQVWDRYKPHGQEEVLIFSNTKVHQYNGYDCGPRVMLDIMQAVDGVSYQDRFDTAVNDPRQTLLGEIEPSQDMVEANVIEIEPTDGAEAAFVTSDGFEVL